MQKQDQKKFFPIKRYNIKTIPADPEKRLFPGLEQILLCLQNS